MDVDHTPQKLLIMLTARWKMASHRTGEVKGSKGLIQNQGSCESGQVVEHTKFLGDCSGTGELCDQRLILSVRLIIQILHQRMNTYIRHIITLDIVLDKTKSLYIYKIILHQPTRKVQMNQESSSSGCPNLRISLDCQIMTYHRHVPWIWATLWKIYPSRLVQLITTLLYPYDNFVKISQANRSCTAVTNKIASFLAVT